MPSTEPVRRSLAARAGQVLRAYVFNRTVAVSLFLTSPAILSSAVSLGMAASVDRSLAGLGRERASLAQDMGRLDTFMKDFDNAQVLRASFLLVMTADAASQDLRYLLDRLYRQNAKGALRRIAAVIYPATWKETFAGYETVVDAAYADKAAIDTLQNAENRILADAAARSTALQAEINRLSERIDRLESRKTFILTIGTSLAYVLTILLFFIKTAGERAPAPRG